MTGKSYLGGKPVGEVIALRRTIAAPSSSQEQTVSNVYRFERHVSAPSPVRDRLRDLERRSREAIEASDLINERLGRSGSVHEFRPDAVPVLGAKVPTTDLPVALDLHPNAKLRARKPPVLPCCKLGQVDRRDAQAPGESGHATPGQLGREGSEVHGGVMQCAQSVAKHNAQLAVMQLAYAFCMEIERLEGESPRHFRRRVNLRLLVGTGSKADFAALVGTPKSHLSNLLSGARGIGDELAAKIESTNELPAGWLDEPHTASPSDENALNLAKIRALRPDTYEMLTAQIESALSGIQAEEQLKKYLSDVPSPAAAPATRRGRL
jgi:hypothetical protein